jgi:antitoxin component of RelBE/YafQ-DinJ toxin-antitoxin module
MKATISTKVDRKVKEKSMDIIQNKLKTTMTKFMEDKLKELIKDNR